MPLGSFRTAGGLGRKLAPAFTGITATGGTTENITIGGITYKMHKFTSGGTFTVSNIGSDGKIDFLVVGGGGAGASRYSQSAGPGGGGGGGIQFVTNHTVTATSYTITVGNQSNLPTFFHNAINGNNSSAFGYTAGGGRGGRNQNLGDNNGGDSGSPQSKTGGTATSGQQGGGGAGAGANGSNGGNTNGGNGGAGLYYGDYFGTGVGVSGYFAGGGGGGNNATGQHGGGNSGDSGTANTGGGGGGGVSADGTRGASGIVLIRYRI